MFSPDGRWLAYWSDESGQPEVYVLPFPGPGGKYQVSTGGGGNPNWSRTGRFYGTLGGKIMVVPYMLEADSFLPGKPTRWSDTTFVPRPLGWGWGNFDLHPDRERVALQSASETQGAEAPDSVVFITNFFDELRRLTAEGGK